MVLKPIQRTTPRCIGAAATLRRRHGGLPRARSPRRRAAAPRRCPALDQAHEDLLEPVDLVAHAEHFDAQRRQPREHVVEVLLLRHLDLQRVVVDAASTRSPSSCGAAASGSRRLSTKVSVCSLRSRLLMRSRSTMRPPSMMAMLRQRRLGFLEVVRGEDDGGAARVDLAQELPHRAADLDVDARRSARRGSAAAARASARARSSAAASCRPTGRATMLVALVPQLQLLQVFLGALRAPPGAGCRRTPPGSPRWSTASRTC